ncbi:MAG TPA: ATP-binding protein [Stellaceae bacterium]|jgi:PAS domain S-box-containing protein|nr:ATP-binding protein [Stellaceae bacterium]
MGPLARCARFLGSRSGQGFILYLCLCQLLAAGIGYGFYASNLSWFKEHKSEEKVTALQLVDAFVNTYASLRTQLSADKASVPATFRADAIAAFDKAHGDDGIFNLQMVGFPGREIKTPPLDPAMADAIRSFADTPAPKPISEVLTIKGEPVFRTVYPSLASQQSCVDCHNQLQAGRQTWHLNEVMGAFAIDVPMGAFLHSNIIEATGLGTAIFLIMAAAGAIFALYHHRTSAETEAAQLSLADSEARFRDFAEATSDWFWEQDDSLRFVRFSGDGRTNEITSTSDIGKTRHETVKTGVTPEQWAQHDADLAARRPFQNFRFQRTLDNGRVIHVSISGKPVFDTKGQFRGYRGSGRDVTKEVAVELELAHRVDERTAELRAAQSELVRKERLSALGQLTATMAHELRNPLSAIRNTLFAVKETAASKGIDLERPLTRVERSVMRCDRIINDLLDYTRVKELHLAEIAPDAWVEEVLSEQRLPAGIELVRHLDADCLIAIDPERVRRVLINLIDNAAQAMPEDGRERKITVTTALVDDDDIEIAIADTGAGIAADVLPKVFEPLFSTKSFGTGLGLPMVKQIVEQHGGTITITSEVGKGTKVTVRLKQLAQSEKGIAA